MSRAQISDHQPNFLKLFLSTRFQCVHFPGVLSRNAVGISSLLGLTHRAWESGTEVSIDIPGRGWIVNLSLCRYMSCMPLTTWLNLHGNIVQRVYYLLGDPLLALAADVIEPVNIRTWVSLNQILLASAGPCAANLPQISRP